MNRRQFVRTGVVAAGAGGVIAARPRTALAAASDDAADVRSFGALGDGTADDIEAVQRAVQSGPGVLRFRRGRYRLTRPVVVTLPETGPLSLIGDGSATVLMDGPGPAFHFIGTHDRTADPQGFRDTVWDRERMPLISGVEIRGGHAESVGVRLERTMQATLTDLLIRRCRVGVHLVERNRNLLVSHCHIYHNREVGILFDDVNLHQGIVADSHISYNPLAGIWIRGGETRNIQIVGNDIEYNHDVERSASADVFVDLRPDGSTFREGTIVGNTIQARPSPGGANVRVIGGPELRSSGLLAITGNLIGSQTDNIHLVACRGVSVGGNSIYSASDRSLRLERCANVVASGNTIDWNPDHNGKRMVDGVRIVDCDGVVLTGTILENCHAGSVEAGGAIEIDGSRDVTVSDCQILDPRHRAVVLTDAVRCRVTGCTLIDRREKPTMRAAVQVAGRSRDNVIASNTLPPDGLNVSEGTARMEHNYEVRV